MERTQYIESLRDNFEKCIEIVEKKSLDYATASDPFKNFKASLVVGVDPSSGILVRILDKITRIGNLLEKDPHVTDEKIEDTILDAINYLNILKVYEGTKDTRLDV